MANARDPRSSPRRVGPLAKLGARRFRLLPEEFDGLVQSFGEITAGDKTGCENLPQAAPVFALSVYESRRGRSATMRADRIAVFRGATAARNSEGLTRQRPDAVTTVTVR